MMAAQSHSQHYDVLVLGAGISGLACAARLQESTAFTKGSKRLKVLEARNRIGGRINAVHINGSRLDTGANWIHGVGTKEKPNPLMEILPHKRYKQLEGTVTFRPAPRSAPASTTIPREDDDWVDVQSVASLQSRSSETATSNDLVIPSAVAGVLMDSLWPMIEALHEKAATLPEQDAARMTMLSAISGTDDFKQAFKRLPKEYHSAWSAVPQFVEAMEAAPLAAQSAEHTNGALGMSLLEFGIDDFDGDQVFLRDGYLAIVNEIAKDLIRLHLIEFNTRVEAIDWSHTPVEVRTTNGTYTADQVVCTLPLGVLQHLTSSSNRITFREPFFRPQLPADKQEAIHSLGFGTLDKILLVYDNLWWETQPWVSIFKKGIVQTSFGPEVNDRDYSQVAPDSFMGFTDELAGIEVHEDGTSAPGLRLLSLVNLYNLTGYPALSAFVSCANAVHVEAMSDAQAGGIVHRTLTSWLGREPPMPAAVHVTRWASEKESLGSYSHMITGTSETRHRVAFQNPVQNQAGGILRFAGEHTSRNHFATVHGALLSGRREADAILTA